MAAGTVCSGTAGWWWRAGWTGRGMGGGLGPGGLNGRGGGPPALDKQVQRRYSLTLAAMGGNIFNNVNLSPPVGVLESPLFGKSTALAGGFFSSTSFESQH